MRKLGRLICAAAVWITTLNWRLEQWRELPIPPQPVWDLELLHGLRQASPRHTTEPVWKLSWATAPRKVAAIMRTAGIEGPQAGPRGSGTASGS